ncbi:conserved membrane protein of unknown function [Shewanella benthica]|uniref:Uncharacterized protein n=1 Tax=Shewanella benthica TaxID=43661 RepID=A0A330MA76_9GAMM|nr:hypothetical protein [Shewanella benthica]SQH78334.1 conserved membrane protein of unknown function [Shewanella benthica]
MSDLHKLKSRRAKLRELSERSHIRSVPKNIEGNRHLQGEIDDEALAFSDMSQEYSERIRNCDTSVAKEEVNALLRTLDDQVDPMDHILEPVFLSLFDGTMRAFKIGTKQGITASRLYSECKSFNYADTQSTHLMVDSYTEYLNERDNIAKLDSESSYNKGKIIRDDSSMNMRDSTKMGKAVKEHFDGEQIATDSYGGDEKIFANTTQAKSTGNKNQATEADHVIPCSEICKNLKKNKALTDSDIRDIVNTDQNLVATSKHNNRGVITGKFGKSQSELQQEVDQGYIVDAKGKKHTLSEQELKIRKNMVDKMETAQEAIDSKTNDKVMDNIKNNKEVQKRMATDASNAAANQSLGDLIIFMIKPLYFELKDCFVNGIENGVDANSFKSALSIRINRIKSYVMEQAGGALKGGAFSFFKSFVSMLLEGIVNCFVGVFKSIFRMVKEGFKVLMQIAPILRDKNKTMVEKGDAILKLSAASLSIFASIGIESWLNSMGIGEPWSIIISSVLTAVLTALAMYLLDKMDLFGLKEEARLNRIDEILTLRVGETKEEMFSMVRSLS